MSSAALRRSPWCGSGPSGTAQPGDQSVSAQLLDDLHAALEFVGHLVLEEVDGLRRRQASRLDALQRLEQDAVVAAEIGMVRDEGRARQHRRRGVGDTRRSHSPACSSGRWRCGMRRRHGVLGIVVGQGRVGGQHRRGIRVLRFWIDDVDDRMGEVRGLAALVRRRRMHPADLVEEPFASLGQVAPFWSPTIHSVTAQTPWW